MIFFFSNNFQCDLQVSVLETRLEEVQSSNATLESQYETAREELLERTGEVSRLGEEEAVRQIQTYR